jgi:hypothetical protein
MVEEIEYLIGKTMAKVENIDNKEIIFETVDGIKYKLYHASYCCECVMVEDIVGELSDLIGSPILMAEESTNNDNPKDKYDESFTWTFYKLSTIKGSVTIRWYGSSNGCCSESVDFCKIT